MSINFCTLTSSSVDTFCGNRRAIVIDALLREKYPPVPTSPGLGTGGAIRREFAYARPQLFDLEMEDRPVLHLEQPFITVSAQLMGEVGQVQVDVKPQLEFVVVTDLKLPEVEVAVNISDLSI